VGRPALILAALAADAARGKKFRHFHRFDLGPDLDALQLYDEAGEGYELIVPLGVAGLAEQAQLMAGLRAITMAAELLPFAVPHFVGQTSDSDQPAILLTMLDGQRPDLSKYAPGDFSSSVGEALAAIHNLDPAVVTQAGLPQYDSARILQGKVTDVDLAAATGKVPPALLGRWEEALENVGLFRFHPCVVHGSISDQSIYVQGTRVTGLAHWSTLAISDPAEDLKYLAGGALPSTFEDALLNYRARRLTGDENIAQRASLYSEIDLASWLTNCIQLGDENLIAEAQSMLEDLAQQLSVGALKPLRAAGLIGLGVAIATTPTWQSPEQLPPGDSDGLFR
jgi:aminoglycoside phosphotransferase (APT) family kinase protein